MHFCSACAFSCLCELVCAFFQVCYCLSVRLGVCLYVRCSLMGRLSKEAIRRLNKLVSARFKSK